MLMSTSEGGESLRSDVFTLVKLSLTLPASTSAAEREFYTLRRVKTYVRSTMDQERLNHMMILHAYKERVDEIELNKLLYNFIRRNDLRHRTVAVPVSQKQ
jgi:hypothetical protein